MFEFQLEKNILLFFDARVRGDGIPTNRKK